MLTAMCRAPSAGNLQPWRFIVVRDHGVRSALANAAYDQGFIAEAPAVFVICADADRSATHYGTRGRTLYVIQDTAAATVNLLISATALGYGSCWVGAFDEDLARHALGLPQKLRPVALVPVGKPAARSIFTERRPWRDVVEMR